MRRIFVQYPWTPFHPFREFVLEAFTLYRLSFTFSFFFLWVTGRQIRSNLSWDLGCRRGPPVKISSAVLIPVAAVSKHVQIENTAGGTWDNFQVNGFFSAHSEQASTGRLMSQALYLLPFITLPFITFYCVAGTKYQHEPSGPSIQRLWNAAANTLAFLMKPNWFEMQQTE